MSVQYIPSKSEAISQAPALTGAAEMPVPTAKAENTQNRVSSTQSNNTEIQQWRACLQTLNQQFHQAVHEHRAVEDLVLQAPMKARVLTEALLDSCLAEMASGQELVLHLLSDAGSESSASHSVNVAVLSVLLGKAMGLHGVELRDLGLAALLHDMGKLALPVSPFICGMNLKALDEQDAESSLYARHVGESVALAQDMDLSPAVTSAIAQHHEWADGSGFPLHLLSSDMERAGQILGLVNSYDRLCNPLDGGATSTPHEALALMFSQHKEKFAAEVLAAFVRLVGVYPPGSLVELVDGRHGVVTSVNATYPLKPVLLVLQSAQDGDELELLDLQALPHLGIRRGLSRQQLSRKSLDALLPHRRVCYYFESVVNQRDEKVIL